jgi:membrane-bound ClpP family serine protease
MTFLSCEDYFRFSLAKSFQTANGELFNYNKNRLDTVGSVVFKPLSIFVDHTLRNIRNPLMITVLTIIAIAATTFAFYPTFVLTSIGKILPLALQLQPWVVKLAVFTAIEIQILGLGLRTLGRLSNPVLIQAWIKREISPLSIGAL